MITNEEINRQLGRILADRGWSVNKLSKKASLPQSTINSMLHGKGDYLPSIGTLKKICDALGITLSYFFETLEGDTEFSVEEIRLVNAVRNMTPKKRQLLTLFLEELNADE